MMAGAMQDGERSPVEKRGRGTPTGTGKRERR